MKYRPLGKTGLEVSVIGLGTHQFTGEWAKEFRESEVEALLEEARRLGINFLDTAECYGDHAVEELLGRAISRNRGDWIVATKFGHWHPSPAQKAEAWSAGEVLLQLDASLKALKTDRIDLYQFHSGSNEVFHNEELWAMLNRQVSAGKVRFLGVSLAAGLLQKGDLEQVHAAAEVNAGVIQVLYNRLHREAEEQVLPFCRERRIGVLARVPLAKGFLGGAYRPDAVFPENDTRAAYGREFNRAQLKMVEQIRRQEVPPGQNMAQWALAWCLKHPAVSSVVVGCKSLEQVQSNAAAAELVEP
jgi:aryl-alcohol dehydrogenase-like predicted oxidoreductase